MDSALRAAFRKNSMQPFHLFAHFLGLEWESDEVHPSRCYLRIGPWNQGADGKVAAGALGTLADMGMGFSVWGALRDKTRWPATVDLHVYHIAQPSSGSLRATGYVVAASDSGLITRCEIYDQDGTLCTLGSGVFLPSPKPRGASFPEPGHQGPESEYGKAFTHWVSGLPARAGEALSPLAAYLGIEREGGEPGEWRFRMICGAHNTNTVGVIQGGALYGFVSEALLAQGRSVSPAASLLELKLNYLLPARGTRLICATTLLRAGSRLLTARAVIVDDEGRQVAVATGTMLAAARAFV